MTEGSTPGSTESEPLTEGSTLGSTESEPPSEPGTDTEPNTESDTGNPPAVAPDEIPGTELPPVVDPGETPDTEIPPEILPPSEPGTDTEPSTEIPPEVDPPKEPDTEKPDDKEDPKEPDTEAPEEEPDQEEEEPQDQTPLTNEELIALQKIVIPPAIEESFRFVTVEKDYAVANVENLPVYDGKSGEAAVVGTIPKGGLCYVLNDQDPSWYYVESGVVRGFVRVADLLNGKEADQYVSRKGEANLALASASMEPTENRVFTYTKTTVRSTVVGKKYALCTRGDVNIREGKSDSDRVIGTLAEQALCYILADEGDDWVFVESGDVRGFVKRDCLKTGETVKQTVTKKGEDSYQGAAEQIKPAENKACYYTITSTKKGSISDAIRESMLKYAVQFVGNPYVWGGTSLTSGADCSGFVQSIYGAYGYSLPRVAEDQAQYGMQIPVSEAKPGDLIFYAKDGYVYHVVMYMGDGKTVEAANSRQGIICSTVNTGNAVWATRVISDSDSDKIAQINENAAKGYAYTAAKAGDAGEYLGRFKLTAYCSCPVCCGKWSGGPTASGTIPVQGRTIAMAGVPFGTKLVIGGQIYTVEDRGTPYGHVDLYLNEHQNAKNFGVQYADVYLAN